MQSVEKNIFTFNFVCMLICTWECGGDGGQKMAAGPLEVDEDVKRPEWFLGTKFQPSARAVCTYNS